MYTQAKRKYQEVSAEKQNLEADRAELQQKYAHKAQQARKLQVRPADLCCTNPATSFIDVLSRHSLMGTTDTLPQNYVAANDALTGMVADQQIWDFWAVLRTCTIRA